MSRPHDSDGEKADGLSGKAPLLDAVARFLERDIRPLIADPRLAFRLLVASNLAQVVASEIRHGEGQERTELARLSALLGGDDPEADTGPARAAALDALNRELCRRIREGAITGPALDDTRAHVVETLRARLRIDNPRFDLRATIE